MPERPIPPGSASPRPSQAAPTPRRAFLKLAALAPALAAGCATVRQGQGTGEAPAPAPSPSPSPSDQLAALRAFPLDPAAEPAFVFRARGTRGRVP